MPLKKIFADIGRGVWSSSGGKKNTQRGNPKFYRNSSPPSGSPNGNHIYYEPVEELECSADAALLSSSQSQAGEVIVHRRQPSSSSAAQVDALDGPLLNEDYVDESRAFTEEEFTSAILARKQDGSQLPDETEVDTTRIEDLDIVVESSAEMLSDKVGQNHRVPPGLNNGTSGCVCDGECNCEKHCLNVMAAGQRSSDPGISPIPERRNKGVLGRLKSFASRTSYNTSEDGHSHSSDYEEPDDIEKRVDIRFQRDAKERTSASWVRHLRRDVKKRISRLKNNRTPVAINGDAKECFENHNGHMHTGSSAESIPSGSGSSLQPPTPTSSNRSSTSAGEDENSPYVGSFLGRARALVDNTPSPYDRDGLAFKKGDLIDIIAKHKTGIWIGMVHSRVGHFKFINVEEISLEEWKPRHKRHRVPAHWISTVNKPETLEQLLKQLGLQEYMNVLVLNGYDELDTFKEIEKEDLDNLGIVNPEHGLKLLRAVEMLNGFEFEVEEDNEEEEDQLRQSPRDSGCYASHENLPQQQNLNGHMDGEDVDTSHSESGIHSREGPDLTLPMNNLDLSAESKSSAATIDSKDETLRASVDCAEDLACFNILPTQLESDVFVEDEFASQTTTFVEPLMATEEQEPFVPVTTFANSISSVRRENGISTSCNSLPTVSESPSESRRRSGSSGKIPKSSHGKHIPRKSKDKSVPNHTNHHRHHSLTKESEMSGHSYDWNPYVHGWTSFAKKKDKNGRRRIQEYDDVVSDPAVDPDLSPGRHVYKKTKQRKGSLQELVKFPLTPSPTLMSIVKQKLELENINLFEEPYTDKTGFCGIPPALVQRYAEELEQSLTDIACTLDQLRITSLQQHARRGVPNDFLADSCTIPVIEVNYSCLHSWLVSMGLPMYESNFTSYNYRCLEDISTLTSTDLTTLGILNHKHHRFLESSLRALRTRIGEPYFDETSGETFVAAIS